MDLGDGYTAEYVYEEAEYAAEDMPLSPDIFGQIVYMQDGKYYVAANTEGLVVNDNDGDGEESFVEVAGMEESSSKDIYQFVNIKSESPELVYQLSDSADSSHDTYQYTFVDETGEILDTYTDETSCEEPLDRKAENLHVIDSVMGKNLITGQMVTLHSYFDKFSKGKQGQSEQYNEVLNKKISLGLTSAGKKLYGKILHIEKSKEESEVIGPKRRSIDSNSIGEEYIDNVMLTLKSLVEIDSMQKRLEDRVITVKVWETELEVDVYVGTLRGCARKVDLDSCAWEFVKFGDGLLENADEKFRLRFSNHVGLSIVITKHEDSIKTLKVTLSARERQHVCVLCNKGYKNHNILARHYTMHHQASAFYTALEPSAQTAGAYDCHVCGKALRSQSSLRRHRGVHEPDLRVLECTVCAQRYSDATALKKHLLMHTGLKPHVCGLCERGFTHVGDLNTHRRTHFLPAVHPFVCGLCERTFSRESNMKRHMKIHSNGMHKCHLCGCCYQHSSSLTRHIVQVHVATEIKKDIKDE